LAELECVLDTAGTGRARLALITGESGIGRTTLASELSDRAVARGFTVHWSGLWTRHAAPPYWPWCQLLDDHLARVDGAELTELFAGLSPALATIAPGLASWAGDPPSHRAVDRFVLYRALARFWARAARRHRLLIVIDDLHRSDLESVRLLAHVATVLRDSPVALVATLRTGGPVDEQMALALADLDHCAPVVVPLAGLPRTALGELARAHGVAPDPAVIDLLTLRTAGNPFYAIQLLRMLEPSADGTVSAEALATEVPRHLARAVRRRLALLDPPVIELLQAASVIGPAGAVGVLAATAGLEPDRTLELLGVAADLGLMLQDGAQRWRFVHGVVRDVAYRALPVPQRLRLHERTGEALAAVAAPASELAWHARRTLPRGERHRAVALTVQAGQEYLRRFAYDQAAECFACAVDLSEAQAGTPAQAARLILLGGAHSDAGRPGQARAAFRAAAQAARDDAVLLSAAALGFADPSGGLDPARHVGDPTTIDLLNQALDAIGTEETPTRVRLLARLGAELSVFTDRDRSRSVVEEALAMGGRVGDQPALLAALAVHHETRVVGRGQPGAALAESAEMLLLAQATGDSRALLVAHRARVFDLLVDGALAAVDGEIEAFGQISAELGDIPAHQRWIALWRSMRALLGGRHAEAEAWASKAWRMSDQSSMDAEVIRLTQTVFLRREQTRLTEVDQDIEAFAAERPYSPFIEPMLALRLAEMGNLHEAADALRRLAGQITDLQDDCHWPASWFQLARTAHLVGDQETAEVLYRLGQPMSGQCVPVWRAAVCVGAADLGLAWLAETLGHDHEADRWYASAEARNVRIDARSWLAQARLDHARLLTRRGGAGDLTTAGHLAELARAAADRIGLPAVLVDAEALLSGLEKVATDPGEGAREAVDPAVEPDTSVGVFRRDGSLWELRYAGVSVRMREAKGLADLARLLARPGQFIHVSELIALQSPGAVTSSGADEVFDARARREIRQRLADLATEFDAAEADHDMARAERARTQRAELVDALSLALGLGGRSRRLDDPLERARKTVTARIRNSISRIRKEHPLLATHLDRSVDTGLWCVYQPEHAVTWRL
jgi:predicted ATPase